MHLSPGRSQAPRSSFGLHTSDVKAPWKNCQNRPDSAAPGTGPSCAFKSSYSFLEVTTMNSPPFHLLHCFFSSLEMTFIFFPLIESSNSDWPRCSPPPFALLSSCCVRLPSWGPSQVVTPGLVPRKPVRRPYLFTFPCGIADIEHSHLPPPLESASPLFPFSRPIKKQPTYFDQPYLRIMAYPFPGRFCPPAENPTS